jgi:8-oxo-dGTP pyrophosphatase MutT (NUDIX family)
MKTNHDPVSFKGVLFLAGRVVLLRNERDEWELPGGRRLSGEVPAECVRREILEETGLDVVVGPLLDVWIYGMEAAETLIVTFGCHAHVAAERVPTCSAEHAEIGLFSAGETGMLPLPAGYRSSIIAWERDERRIREGSV